MDSAETERKQTTQSLDCVKVLPREVPSLYGSFPPALHQQVQGFVPAADLDKARDRAAREQAAALPRSSTFCLQQWRWALSVRMPPPFNNALLILTYL